MYQSRARVEGAPPFSSMKDPALDVSARFVAKTHFLAQSCSLDSCGHGSVCAACLWTVAGVCAVREPGGRLERRLVALCFGPQSLLVSRSFPQAAAGLRG